MYAVISQTANYNGATTPTKQFKIYDAYTYYIKDGKTRTTNSLYFAYEKTAGWGDVGLPWYDSPAPERGEDAIWTLYAGQYMGGAGTWNLRLYQDWSGSNYDYTDIYIKGYLTKENASNNVTFKVGTDTFTTSSDFFEFTGTYNSSITKLFEITGSVSSDAIENGYLRIELDEVRLTPAD